MGLFSGLVKLVTSDEKFPLVTSKDLETSKENEKGANWDQNPKPDFIINTDDPRYIKCLETAHAMRDKIDPATGKTNGELLATLDPKNPDDFKKIIAIENVIVREVEGTFREQFGSYNIMGAIANMNGKADDSTHSDWDRRNTENPAQLKEFGKDELVCRHMSPISNLLLAQAGMDVVQITPIIADVIREDGISKPGPVSAHEKLMSLKSGSTIDFTSRHPYEESISPNSAQEYKEGKLVATKSGYGNLRLMEQQPLSNLRTHAIMDEIQEKVFKIAEEKNAGQSDTLKEILHIKDGDSTPKIPDHIKEMSKGLACKDVKCTGSEFTPPPSTSASQGVSQQAR